MMYRNLRLLLLIIRRRYKKSAFLNFILIPFAVFLVSAFSAWAIYTWYPNNYIIGILIFMAILFESGLLIFLLNRKLHITISNLILYPLNRRRIYLIHNTLIMDDRRNLIYIVPIPVIFISLLIKSNTLVSVTFLFLSLISVFCLQVFFINMFLLLPERLKSHVNLPSAFFALMILVNYLPLITKKYMMYNYIPFSGWVGSATNAAQNGEYGTVGFYLGLVLFLLIIGLRMGEILVRPGKKVRWI